MEFMYEHSDIPTGLTLSEYRRLRPRPEGRTPLAFLRSLPHHRRHSLNVGWLYIARSSTSR
jgi:hypothetical protein